jgi:putative ABC transport system ATP-binding protein
VALLTITNLVKSFDSPDGGRRRVIDVPWFALDEAEQAALAGGSGSGKTTLLHLIAGILAPDSGRIELEGRDLSAMSESSRDLLRGRSIGYVFQTFNLLQGYTALQNVELAMMFGSRVDRAWARRLLERVGLGDRMNDRPRQLSVGQQQRVAVARALANHPRIVLADEPTGNLDAARAAEALELIREICAENRAALLLVSHDPAILGRFDRVHQLAQINRAAGRGGGAEGGA